MVIVTFILLGSLPSTSLLHQSSSGTFRHATGEHVLKCSVCLWLVSSSPVVIGESCRSIRPGRRERGSRERRKAEEPDRPPPDLHPHRCPAAMQSQQSPGHLRLLRLDLWRHFKTFHWDIQALIIYFRHNQRRHPQFLCLR